MEDEQISGNMAKNIFNTTRKDFISKQLQEEEYNFLYDDTIVDCGDYDEDQHIEYETPDSYDNPDN